MSYPCMSKGRLRRLRALTSASVLVAAIACNAEETAGPVAEATPPAAATPAAETPAAPAPEMLTSATAPGVPFGDFHLPTSLFSSSLYSGSLQAVFTSSVYSVLNAARNNSERVIISLAGNRSNYTNSDGTFNMSMWKYRVSKFKGYDLTQYVRSGTVIGHYLVDEPFCSSCWGGTKISMSQVEEMARYSKSIWPGMPTGVRSAPTQLGSTPFYYLDFAWGQWEGPLHVPSYKMTAYQYRDAQVAAAQRLKLGVVFGLNYLDGGDGTSHINGTYAQDPNLSDNIYCKSSGSCYRYAMSAKEVKNVGSVLAGSSYGCGLISWKYNSTFVSRTGMKDALSAVAYVAKNRSRSSCVK